MEYEGKQSLNIIVRELASSVTGSMQGDSLNDRNNTIEFKFNLHELMAICSINEYNKECLQSPKALPGLGYVECYVVSVCCSVDC
jgi:hypothetical protein